MCLCRCQSNGQLIINGGMENIDDNKPTDWIFTNPDGVTSVDVLGRVHSGLWAVNIENGKLIITTSGDPIEYCVKSTRTAPTDNALCWKKVENNTASVSVFKYKKYYVWIKDEVGNISNYLTINSNGEKNNQ